ncbi:hypothetical protein A4V12_31710, partial [Streptomyces noursei]
MTPAGSPEPMFSAMAESQAVSFGVPLKEVLAKYCAVQTGEVQVTAAEAGAAVIMPLTAARTAVAASVLSRVRVITEKEAPFGPGGSGAVSDACVTREAVAGLPRPPCVFRKGVRILSGMWLRASAVATATTSTRCRKRRYAYDNARNSCGSATEPRGPEREAYARLLEKLAELYPASSVTDPAEARTLSTARGRGHRHVHDPGQLGPPRGGSPCGTGALYLPGLT